ncbi:helix-turn-helix domain-containing protein [Planctomycetes bacterium Poly30]|uniref:helix-turn-helix domain-containing protein n=1 Tax=Saltatorellus ferox TaxID=2528018 RepID=UPI00119D0120
MNQTFGQLLRENRKSLGLTLRAFAESCQLDPGYLSRLERGVIPPPTQADRLDQLATAVGLPQGSAERTAFCDAAAIGSGRLPQDLVSDEQLMSKLPVLFRTARGETPSREELEALAEFLRDK